MHALKAADEERQRDASSQNQQMEQLERQRQQQLDEIERLKAELQGMGLSSDQIERATKKGSAFCSVM